MKNQYFKELDKMAIKHKCMFEATPDFNKLHPELGREECNDIMLDWIKERSYYARYTKETNSP